MSRLRIPSLGAVALMWACLSAFAQRMVVIDQDGSGPGGSNQMAMMVLLQSPKVKVLGITMVSGNAWEPEEVQHTLRMLELIGRTDVPVAAGAVYPLMRTQEETILEKRLTGSFAWYGAWGDLAAKTSGQPYHDAFVVPAMEEGAPTTKTIDEDAAPLSGEAGAGSSAPSDDLCGGATHEYCTGNLDRPAVCGARGGDCDYGREPFAGWR